MASKELEIMIRINKVNMKEFSALSIQLSKISESVDALNKTSPDFASWEKFGVSLSSAADAIGQFRDNSKGVSKNINATAKSVDALNNVLSTGATSNIKSTADAIKDMGGAIGSTANNVNKSSKIISGGFNQIFGSARLMAEGFGTMIVSQAAWAAGFLLIFAPIYKFIDLLGKAIDIENEFARSTRVLRSESQALSGPFGALSQASLTMQTAMVATGSSAKAVGEIMYQLGSAGLSAEESIAALHTTLNTVIASEASAQDVTKLIAGIYNELGDKIVKTSDGTIKFVGNLEKLKGQTLSNITASEKFKVINDLLITAFDQHQVEVNELTNGLKYSISTANQVGISFTELVGSLVTLNDHLIKSGVAGRSFQVVLSYLSKDSQKFIDAFNLTGLDPSKPLELIPVLEQINSKLGDGTLTLDQLGTAFGLVNLRGAKALLTLAQNVVELKGNIAELELETTGAAEKMASIMIERPVAAFNRFNNLLIIIIRESLYPLVTAFYAVIKVFNAVGTSLVRVNELLGGIPGLILGIVASIGILQAASLTFVFLNKNVDAFAAGVRLLTKYWNELIVSGVLLRSEISSLSLIFTKLSVIIINYPVAILLTAFAALTGAVLFLNNRLKEQDQALTKNYEKLLKAASGAGLFKESLKTDVVEAFNRKLKDQSGKLSDTAISLDKSVKKYGANSVEAQNFASILQKLINIQDKNIFQFERAANTFKKYGIEIKDAKDTIQSFSNETKFYQEIVNNISLEKQISELKKQKIELDKNKESLINNSNEYSNFIDNWNKITSKSKEVTDKINILTEELNKNRDAINANRGYYLLLEDIMHKVGQSILKLSSYIVDLGIDFLNFINPIEKIKTTFLSLSGIIFDVLKYFNIGQDFFINIAIKADQKAKAEAEAELRSYLQELTGDLEESPLIINLKIGKEFLNDIIKTKQSFEDAMIDMENSARERTVSGLVAIADQLVIMQVKTKEAKEDVKKLFEEFQKSSGKELESYYSQFGKLEESIKKSEKAVFDLELELSKINIEQVKNINEIKDLFDGSNISIGKMIKNLNKNRDELERYIDKISRLKEELDNIPVDNFVKFGSVQKELIEQQQKYNIAIADFNDEQQVLVSYLKNNFDAFVAENTELEKQSKTLGDLSEKYRIISSEKNKSTDERLTALDNENKAIKDQIKIENDVSKVRREILQNFYDAGIIDVKQFEKERTNAAEASDKVINSLYANLKRNIKESGILQEIQIKEQKILQLQLIDSIEKLTKAMENVVNFMNNNSFSKPFEDVNNAAINAASSIRDLGGEPKEEIIKLKKEISELKSELDKSKSAGQEAGEAIASSMGEAFEKLLYNLSKNGTKLKRIFIDSFKPALSEAEKQFKLYLEEIANNLNKSSLIIDLKIGKEFLNDIIKTKQSFEDAMIDMENSARTKAVTGLVAMSDQLVSIKGKTDEAKESFKNLFEEFQKSSGKELESYYSQFGKLEGSIKKSEKAVFDLELELSKINIEQVKNINEIKDAFDGSNISIEKMIKNLNKNKDELERYSDKISQLKEELDNIPVDNFVKFGSVQKELIEQQKTYNKAVDDFNEGQKNLASSIRDNFDAFISENTELEKQSKTLEDLSKKYRIISSEKNKSTDERLTALDNENKAIKDQIKIENDVYKVRREILQNFYDAGLIGVKKFEKERINAAEASDKVIKSLYDNLKRNIKESGILQEIQIREQKILQLQLIDSIEKLTKAMENVVVFLNKNSLSKPLDNMRKSSDDANESFKKLGYNSKEEIIKLKKEISELKSGLDKSKNAGKEAGEAIASSMSEAFEELKPEINNLGKNIKESLTPDLSQAESNFNAYLKKLANDVDENPLIVNLKISENFLHDVNNYISSFKDIMSNIEKDAREKAVSGLVAIANQLITMNTETDNAKESFKNLFEEFQKSSGKGLESYYSQFGKLEESIKKSEKAVFDLELELSKINIEQVKNINEMKDAFDGSNISIGKMIKNLNKNKDELGRYSDKISKLKEELDNIPVDNFVKFGSVQKELIEQQQKYNIAIADFNKEQKNLTTYIKNNFDAFISENTELEKQSKFLNKLSEKYRIISLEKNKSTDERLTALDNEKKAIKDQLNIETEAWGVRREILQNFYDAGIIDANQFERERTNAAEESDRVIKSLYANLKRNIEESGTLQQIQIREQKILQLQLVDAIEKLAEAMQKVVVFLNKNSLSKPLEDVGVAANAAAEGIQELGSGPKKEIENLKREIELLKDGLQSSGEKGSEAADAISSSFESSVDGLRASLLKDGEELGENLMGSFAITIKDGSGEILDSFGGQIENSIGAATQIITNAEDYILSSLKNIESQADNSAKSLKGLGAISIIPSFSYTSNKKDLDETIDQYEIIKKTREDQSKIEKEISNDTLVIREYTGEAAKTAGEFAQNSKESMKSLGSLAAHLESTKQFYINMENGLVAFDEFIEKLGRSTAGIDSILFKVKSGIREQIALAEQHKIAQQKITFEMSKQSEQLNLETLLYEQKLRQIKGETDSIQDLVSIEVQRLKIKQEQALQDHAGYITKEQLAELEKINAEELLALERNMTIELTRQQVLKENIEKRKEAQIKKEEEEFQKKIDKINQERELILAKDALREALAARDAAREEANTKKIIDSYTNVFDHIQNTFNEINESISISDLFESKSINEFIENIKELQDSVKKAMDESTKKIEEFKNRLIEINGEILDLNKNLYEMSNLNFENLEKIRELFELNVSKPEELSKELENVKIRVDEIRTSISELDMTSSDYYSRNTELTKELNENLIKQDLLTGELNKAQSEYNAELLRREEIYKNEISNINMLIEINREMSEVQEKIAEDTKLSFETRNEAYENEKSAYKEMIDYILQEAEKRQSILISQYERGVFSEEQYRNMQKQLANDYSNEITRINDEINNTIKEQIKLKKEEAEETRKSIEQQTAVLNELSEVLKLLSKVIEEVFGNMVELSQKAGQEMTELKDNISDVTQKIKNENDKIKNSNKEVEDSYKRINNEAGKRQAIGLQPDQYSYGAKGYATGGIVSAIPARVTKGEGYVAPSFVKGNLSMLNAINSGAVRSNIPISTFNGPGGVDNIPMMLPKGSYVISLRGMNNIKGYADGGYVSNDEVRNLGHNGNSNNNIISNEAEPAVFNFTLNMSNGNKQTIPLYGAKSDVEKLQKALEKERLTKL